MTGEVRFERVGMSELFRADDAHVWERVLVDTPVSFEVPVVGEVRPAVGALERLLAGVDAPMRLHALQVVEGGAAKVTQIRTSLQATAQVTVKAVLLRERTAAPVARVHVHFGMNDCVTFNCRQPVGGELAPVEGAFEDPLGAVLRDDVPLVFDWVTERRVAVRTAECLLGVAASVSSKRTGASAPFAASPAD